jgi:hypothetical protein
MPDPALKASADWAASATDVLQEMGLAGAAGVKEWLARQREPYEVRRAFAKETLDGLNLIRHSRGPFQILVYEPPPPSNDPSKAPKHPQPEVLRQAVLAGTALAGWPFAPRAEVLLTGPQKDRILTTHLVKGPWSVVWNKGDEDVPVWQPVIAEEAIRAVRERFGLGVLPPAGPPPGMPPGMLRPQPAQAIPAQAPQ